MPNTGLTLIINQIIHNYESQMSSRERFLFREGQELKIFKFQPLRFEV